jgi:hypothetical protein
MKTIKIIPALLLFLSTASLFSSCGKKSIEQQVEEIMQTDDWDDRQSIAHSLADSLKVRPAELLLGLHTDTIAIRALKTMLGRYSEIIISNPAETDKALTCVRFIIEPDTLPGVTLNEKKVELIVHSLSTYRMVEVYKNTLINSALLHGDVAMEKLIDECYQNINSAELLDAIKAFDEDAVLFLSDRIETDSMAVELLARIGEAAVGTMVEKMKADEQSTRFAAGGVLAKMTKYDPGAVDFLTSAFDNGGTKIIAENYPFYIRMGKVGSEEIMLKALDKHFGEGICLDYLNCGNPMLEEGANEIANKRGYLVTRGIGHHSGPIWGSGN